MLINMPRPYPDDRPAPGPLALRALAHPLRWKLLDLLGSEQSATATRCAEVLGESVASCSYHLGMLAKYGYIEPVPGQPGREKPWQLTRRQQVLSSEGLDEPGALAAQAATEVFLDHELARVKDRLRRQDLEPAEWRAASQVLGVTTWLTVSELQEVTDQLGEIARRHADRFDDPGLRPPGARETRIFTVTSVAPRPPRPR
jgi:predicted ArsR family transcriptional regulator